MESLQSVEQKKSSDNNATVVPIGYLMNNPNTELSKEEQQEFFKRDLASLDSGLSEAQIASLAETAAEEMCSLEEKKIREADMETLSGKYRFNKDKKVRLWDFGGTLFGVLRNVLYPAGGLCAIAIPIGAILEFPIFSQSFNRYATCATGVFVGLATGCHKISAYMYGRRDERKAMLLRQKAYGGKMTRQDIDDVFARRHNNNKMFSPQPLREPLLSPKLQSAPPLLISSSSPILKTSSYKAPQTSSIIRSGDGNNNNDDDDN
jgi:hypothetical protein